MTILILMATYNGARFLPAQLASVAAQTEPDWRLLARDDGSTDATPAILRQASKADPRIELLAPPDRRQGAADSFAWLMEAALARHEPWIAFADQDDVWLPHKLRRLAARLADLEQAHGRTCPILVHSDLEVVDAALRPIHASLMRFQLIGRPGETPPATLLVQNHVVGCSMMINRALLRLAAPVPGGVHMHDWWIALCAAFGGIVDYIPEPLVRYRQHAGNRIGAQGAARRLARPWHWPAWLAKMNRIYRTLFVQAAQLRRRLPPSRELAALDRFLAVRDRPRLLRPWHLLRLGVRRQNAVMTALLYVQALFLHLPRRSC